MIELNSVTAIFALLLILVSPISGIWSGLKISAVTQRLDLVVAGWKEERRAINARLDKLQTKSEGNSNSIASIEGIMEDRKDRS